MWQKRNCQDVLPGIVTQVKIIELGRKETGNEQKKIAKTYTFTVFATLCEEDEKVTREQALESLQDWLEAYENDSDLMGCSEFEKIEIK